MKGISLAIETIIVLILAVSVMTVMLFLFRSQVGSAQDTFELINMQRDSCTGYIFYDPRCNDDVPIDLINDLANSDIKKNIATACKGLNRQRGDYPACAGASTANLDCIQQCCRMFCPSI